MGSHIGIPTGSLILLTHGNSAAPAPSTAATIAKPKAIFEHKSEIPRIVLSTFRKVNLKVKHVTEKKESERLGSKQVSQNRKMCIRLQYTIDLLMI